MKIAVASGKGGAGKTSVAAALARMAPGPLTVLDCDVEAPDTHLLLPLTGPESKDVCVPVPEIRAELCGGCGRCAQFCAYHALVCFGDVPLVMEDLCHGCGGCMRVCPHKAIREVMRKIGTVTRFSVEGQDTLSVIQGALDIGVAMASPVIRAVKAGAKASSLVLIDAPPGTACAAATALEGADYVLLVAEETRFGQHDLSFAVDLVRKMGLSFGVVINRAVKGRNKVKNYCKRQNIPVLAVIPEDPAITGSYIRGTGMTEAMPGMKDLFAGLWQEILQRVSDPLAESAA